jgi:hypothetical protein
MGSYRLRLPAVILANYCNPAAPLPGQQFHQ